MLSELIYEWQKGSQFLFDITAFLCYVDINNTRHASVERHAHPSGLFYFLVK